MANYTINNLPNTVSSISDSDILPVWDSVNEQTAKVTRENLLGVSKNEVIVSSSTTLTGATLETNAVIRVMFTSAITGSDTTTALSLSYNDTAYSVKVGKQGSLSNFVASYVDSTYTYLQAYTTLELAFDGTQFIIIGNPVVLSSSDYTIYADGGIVYSIKCYSLVITIPSGQDYYDLDISDYIDGDLLSNHKLLYNVQISNGDFGASSSAVMGFATKASSGNTIRLFFSASYDVDKPYRLSILTQKL